STTASFPWAVQALPPAMVTIPDLVDGRAVTLVAALGTTLTNVVAVPNPSLADAPRGVSFPIGFFQFEVTGLQPGGSTTVTLSLPSGVRVTDFWKYGPTADVVAPNGMHPSHWYEFLFDGHTGAEIRGTQIILHLVDGQRGDDDLTANGVIMDP